MEEEGHDLQGQLNPPQYERWAPVGASSNLDSVIFSEPERFNSDGQFRVLEKEKEKLQQSLFSLTSRFAQIQFRLHQIVEAEPDDKARLLKELNALANQGCVDISIAFATECKANENGDGGTSKHGEIIQELKKQLDDLENYAFRHGSGKVPQSVMLQKQHIVLEELINKLGLNVDTEELGRTSIDKLKGKVDDAVAEIVHPAIIKGKLVDHLQTQIQDLERFVEFLQVEIDGNSPKSSGSVPQASPAFNKEKKRQNIALFRKALQILQMFAMSQLSCGTKTLQSETMQDEIRPSTEQLLNNLKKAVKSVKDCAISYDTEADSDQDEAVSHHELYHLNAGDNSGVLPVDCALTHLVRKLLCPAIMNLLAHGLVVDATASHNTSLVTPISCILPSRLTKSLAVTPLHPWELFIEYYEAKRGADLAKAPSRMLTRSFGLEPLVSGVSTHKVSVRNSLLEAIHLILKEHNPLKRSYDAMLKALICLGLNSGRLVLWIRLIMKTSWLISNHYTEFSYVAQTAFEGALTILSRLDSCSFSLPVDLAIRPFKNIKDAF